MLMMLAFTDDNNTGGNLSYQERGTNPVKDWFDLYFDKLTGLLVKIVEGLNLKKLKEGSIVIILVLIIALTFTIGCLKINTSTSNIVAIILPILALLIIYPFIYIYVKEKICKLNNPPQK